MGKKWKRVLLTRRIAKAKEECAEEVVVEKVAPIKAPPPTTVEDVPLVTKTATKPTKATTKTSTTVK